jgi:hypothetical protein
MWRVGVVAGFGEPAACSYCDRGGSESEGGGRNGGCGDEEFEFRFEEEERAAPGNTAKRERPCAR